MMNWYGGGYPVMWMGMGLFWVLLIGAIVWLVVELTGRRSDAAQVPPRTGAFPQGPTTTVDSPLDLLDRRLAAGQIDVAAYREARAALLESNGGKP